MDDDYLQDSRRPWEGVRITRAPSGQYEVHREPFAAGAVYYRVDTLEEAVAMAELKMQGTMKEHLDA